MDTRNQKLEQASREWPIPGAPQRPLGPRRRILPPQLRKEPARAGFFLSWGLRWANAKRLLEDSKGLDTRNQKLEQASREWPIPGAPQRPLGPRRRILPPQLRKEPARAGFFLSWGLRWANAKRLLEDSKGLDTRNQKLEQASREWPIPGAPQRPLGPRRRILPPQLRKEPARAGFFLSWGLRWATRKRLLEDSKGLDTRNQKLEQASREWPIPGAPQRPLGPRRRILPPQLRKEPARAGFFLNWGLRWANAKRLLEDSKGLDTRNQKLEQASREWPIPGAPQRSLGPRRRILPPQLRKEPARAGFFLNWGLRWGNAKRLLGNVCLFTFRSYPQVPSFRIVSPECCQETDSGSPVDNFEK